MDNIVGLIILLFHFQTLSSEWIVKSTLEMDDCMISFIERFGEKLVVKQIKDPSPEEQFLLVTDALGCHIAESSNIPVNKVSVINSPFPGKDKEAYPATLHTMAEGISTADECRYYRIDIHQRFRKENTPMWHLWGPLSPEKTGLTLTVIRNMAQHSDLPVIVALDTFLGNADRSCPNLFYNHLTDRFCGIDMAASFSSPLASVACGQIKNLKDEAFSIDELQALLSYRKTLEFLINHWSPEKQMSLLLEFAQRAGFEEGNFLYNQEVKQKIEFHEKCILENYKNSIELVALIKEIPGLSQCEELMHLR